MKNFLAGTTLALMTGFAFSSAPVPSAHAQDAKAPERVRVRGIIETVTGDSLIVKTREGTEAKIVLKKDWKVAGVQKASVDDIKPGDFVGVASLPKAEGEDGALEVLIFPAAMKGTGEGSRPWDLKENSTMTNATVAKAVTAVDGHTITLTYEGKEKTISIANDTPIVTLAPASKDDLKPNAAVFINGEKAGDGSVSTSQVAVGIGGLVPPM